MADPKKPAHVRYTELGKFRTTVLQLQLDASALYGLMAKEGYRDEAPLVLSKVADALPALEEVLEAIDRYGAELIREILGQE